MNAPYVPPAFHVQTQELLIAHEQDEHRRFNYELCTSLDLTKLHITIDKMIEAGLDEHLGYLYFMQAQTLLATLCSENNRLALDKARGAPALSLEELKAEVRRRLA